MALDPSIALQGTNQQVDPMAGMERGMKMAQAGLQMQATQQQIAASQQSVAASQAQQANTEAQNPGIVAQSQSAQAKAQQDQQDAAAMQYATQIAPQYTTHNPDGSTTVDTIGIGNDMASKGFIKQGGQYVKQWMDGVSSNADAVKKLQDNTSELNKAQLQVAGPLLNQAARIPDPVARSQFLDNALQTSESSYPQLFPKGTTSNMAQLFDRAKVDPVGAASFAVTPEKWIQQGIDKQNADTGRINAIAGQTSVNTGVLAQKIGVQGAVTANNTDASIYDNGVQAVQGLRDPNTGQLPSGVGALSGAALENAISTNPSLTALKGAIQKAQADGQTIDYSGGYQGIQQQLRLLSQTKKDAAVNLVNTQNQAGRSLPPSQPAAPTIGTNPAGTPKQPSASSLKYLQAHPDAQTKALFKQTYGFLPQGY